MRRTPAIALALMASAGFAASGGVPTALADERVPYTIDVESASAKVGEPTAVVATSTPPEGYKITRSYRNRVIELSSYDDGVEFEKAVVLGSIQDAGSVVFEVGVTPTKPGAHPINGVIRVGFHHRGHSETKSVPLMATVTGAD